MTYGNLSVDSITTSTPQGVLGAGNASLMKNRIINGAMIIDQRNAGASYTLPAANPVYTLDRWAFQTSQASKLSTQQNQGSVTPPAGFSNYLGVTSLSSYSITSSDYFSLLQRIEGFNTADLNWGTTNAKTVTLSFQVYSSLTGTFGGALQNSTFNRSYPFSYSVPVANTWTTVSVTIAGDTTGTWVGATNGIGIIVCFSLGSGSTYAGTAGSWQGSGLLTSTGATSVVGTSGATFYITGVQLEVGSVATGFEYEIYSQTLAKCQRYYMLKNTVVSTASTFQAVHFPQMRTYPTIGTIVTESGTGTVFTNGAGAGVTTAPSYIYQTNANSTTAVASIPLSAEL